MRRRHWLPASRRSHATLLAGWLFADLCLVLFLINLASAPTKACPTASGACPKPTVKPTPTRKPTPTVRVLETSPQYLYITDITATDITSGTKGGPEVSHLIGELESMLRANGWEHRQAGFVFIWADAPESGISAATASAKATLSLVKKYDPAVFGSASGDGGWNGQGSGFKFEIFFYA